jgi:hypothetical protein
MCELILTDLDPQRDSLWYHPICQPAKEKLTECLSDE